MGGCPAPPIRSATAWHCWYSGVASPKPAVALIGTGGTIASRGDGPLELLNYAMDGTRLSARDLMDYFPEMKLVADIVPLECRPVASTEIGFPEWQDISRLCCDAVAAHPGLAGIVIAHGTATIEETAYHLDLTLALPVAVVLVGAQRPASALSSDAGLNLVNAIRTAACPAAAGMGVLVVMNDEIHASREVTKTSTLRLQAMRSPDFGALGHVDGDRVVFYRSLLRRTVTDTVFAVASLTALPRVDIVYSHAGADDVAIRAFVDAGAAGLVSAGFAPGTATSAQ
ncbi:MAG: asparaginase, partial [Gemmatimonadaceae bacterium]|nr:asparaginase [Acetobacteraceae bacterium]